MHTQHVTRKFHGPSDSHEQEHSNAVPTDWTAENLTQPKGATAASPSFEAAALTSAALTIHSLIISARQN